VLGRRNPCPNITQRYLGGRVSQAGHPDPLKPALEKAQAELAKHLDEACESQADDVSQVSVDELLQLEEELLAAARAADEAARLRRRLDQQDSSGRGPTPGTAGAAAPAPPGAGDRIREFRDRSGQMWRVWEVRPGVDRPLRDLRRYLGDYLNGWLAFGCLDNERRKRLPKYPPDWLQLSDSELEELLDAAVDVPIRKKSGAAAVGSGEGVGQGGK
jgi:hypothetical protein